MIIPVSVDRASGMSASCEADGKTADGETKKITRKGVDVPEWSMVELQGELVSKDPLSGQPLGSMISENGKPVLLISHHKLEGKAASEPKPLLVLRKVIVDPEKEDDSTSRTNGNSGDIGNSLDTGSGGALGGNAGRVGRPQLQRKRVEYRVVGKVTRKTIFKTRPKPLMRKLGGGIGPGGGSTGRSQKQL